TLFNDTITVPANCTVVDTSNVSHYIDHPTALGALVEAANQSGFTYNITDWGWGLGIDDINGDTWVQYRVGAPSPSVGAENYNLTGGEYVLFATGQYYPFYPLYLTAQPHVTSPFEVNVRYYNDSAKDWLPLEGATVFVDGTPAGTTTNAYGNLALNLPTGTYQLRAEKVGYIRSEKVNVSVVDLTPPVITITSPADGSTTRFTTVGLSVKVNERSSIWYSVDGGANSTPVNGTSIGATITGLSEGAHNIVVYARDKSGNLGWAQTSFTVDLTPPTVTIASPTEGTTYNTTSVPLNADMSEDGKMWYSLDGAPNSTPVVSRHLGVMMRMLSDGSHTVVVYGRDTVGNVNSSSVSFNVSVPKPDLTSTIDVQVVAGGSSTVSTGTTLKLNAIITNNGAGDAPPTHAAFYIDGVKLADRPVRALAAAGDSVTVHVTWVPVNPAQYDIVSMADSLHKVVETNESDNNDTWMLTATGVPDLVATNLEYTYRIPVNTPTNLTLTVNCRDASATNIPVELFERKWVSGHGYRYLPVAGASTVISSMAAGSTQQVNLTYTPTSYGYKYLRAAIDPNNTITETSKANNNITRGVSVSYSDLRAYIYGMSSVALGFETNIRVYVGNRGGLPAGEETLTVWADNGTTNSTLYTTAVPAIGAWRSRTYTVPWTPTAGGTYTITALVSANNTSDYRHYNNKHVRTITVRDYNITAWYMKYPRYGVYEGRYFYVGAYLNTTGAGYVNASLSFEPASGITVYNPDKRAYTYGRTYDYVYWRCKGDVAGLYNATMTFEANGKSTTISTNDTQWNRKSPYAYRYSPYSPYGVKIIVQTVEVKDENSTVLANTETKNLTYRVFDVNSTDQNGKVDIIAGGTQRMLTGLNYLMGYPHGCVEQVASPLVAALRIAEYYAAYGYLDATNNSSLNCTVGKAVYDLQYGHLKPYTNGAWSMWGRRHSTSDDSQYFTTYSVYSLAIVRNSTLVDYSVINNQRSDCRYSSYFPIAVNDTLIDKGAVWLTTQQQTNATQGWWVGRGRDYIRSPNTLSAWVVRSLIVAKPFSEAGHQDAIQASIDRGIAFLLDHQNPDGGWADEKGRSGAYGVSNAYTTGLVLHVLATSNNTSAEVTAAKNNATNWLVAHQLASGRFEPTSRDMAGHSYSRTGVYTEAAAYPLLALNATGINATNLTIEKGRDYLFGVYQSDGSWGYTKSSAVVIDALTKTIIPGGIINLNITVGIDGSPVAIVHLNNSNPKATIPLWGDRTNASSPLGAGNHTVSLVQVGDGNSLVGVTHSQTVPKREAIANVPSEYIDPLAEEFSLNLTYHDASTANASLAPELSSAVVNEKVRVNATVTNINTTDGLLVLIMDVPIPANTTFSQDSLDPLSYSGDLVNGTLEWFSNTSYTDACNWSYNTSSRMLSIYPEQLNASEKKSYFFNVSYNTSGVQSLTNVNVKPMYNPTLIAENNSSIYVKGYDSVSFELLNESEGAVSATLKWNGSGEQSGTGIIYNNTTLEGDYALNFTSTGYLPVLSTISVLPNQLANYTATFFTALSEPEAVFFEKNSSTATLPVEFTNGSGWMYYNTTLVTAGGVVTVAMEKPAGNDVVFV
ncbi:MAG: CARDB domain-containing protein, partial [Methermicoccaceae archaeon]